MKINTRRLAVLLVTVLFSGIALAQTPQKAEVRSAITRLLKTPVDHPTSDMALVLFITGKCHSQHPAYPELTFNSKPTPTCEHLRIPI
ncbi:MAG: hypothetical protein H7145_08520 [Akkermansiaceae bacterium]|nr:hypothetical protein [Armatimonadota bacterium]